MRDAVLLRELSVTEMETDPQRFRGFEQRPGRRSWHFALEETIDLRFVFHPPARKETGQRQFRKDHEVAAARLGLAHQFQQP